MERRQAFGRYRQKYSSAYITTHHNKTNSLGARGGDSAWVDIPSKHDSRPETLPRRACSQHCFVNAPGGRGTGTRLQQVHRAGSHLDYKVHRAGKTRKMLLHSTTAAGALLPSSSSATIASYSSGDGGGGGGGEVKRLRRDDLATPRRAC